MLTKRPSSLICLISLFFVPVGVSRADKKASVLPTEFEIYFESFGLDPIEPRASHTLRGLHCTFRPQRRPRSQPPRFVINIEKHSVAKLVYATRWSSVGLNDVISIEGKRYRLAKITDANTRLQFKAVAQSPETPPPGTICIPRSGEAAIKWDSVIFEQGDESNQVAVATLPLTDVQLSRPNNPYHAVGDLIPKQRFSKTRSDAKRVEAQTGAHLTIAGQRYTVTKIVEPDPKEGIVGWIEIAPSVKEVNEEK